MPLRPALCCLMIVLGVMPAHAGCYADYKAKQDTPLRLAYGVAELPDAGCGGRSEAAAVLAPRLASAGWTLLSILSIFGPEGLEERKASAADHYLRY